MTLGGLALYALLVAVGPQEQNSAEPYLQVIGQTITAIEIEGPPEKNPGQMLRLSGLQVGAPYRVVQVRRAMKLLFALGRFETVRVLAIPEGGGVRLRIELPPQPRLLEIQLVDSDVLDLDDVQSLLRFTADIEVAEEDLKVWKALIDGRLIDLGYRSPKVSLSLKGLDSEGGRALVVNIDEGPTTRLRRVRVVGLPRLPLWRIGEGVGIRPGDVLDLEEVATALQGLRAQYRGLGYLDVAIGAPVVRAIEATNRADLIVNIIAGPKVRLRFKGNRIVPARDLKLDTLPLVELGTGPSALSEVRERMLARYAKNGFWKARVEVATRKTQDASKKEVLFSIHEGAVAKVEKIRFPGNSFFTDAELRNQVFGTVARALATDLDRPGADPEVVGLALGDRSLSTPRDSPQPDTTAPDPEKVYLSRAYRNAARSIEDLYRVAGFQNVEVARPRVRLGDRPGQLWVDIEVTQGVRWRVGALSFSGNQEVSSAQLFELSGLELASAQGAPLAFAKVDEARRSIAKHYRNHGYLFARVAEELRQVPPRGSLGWDYVKTSTIAPFDVQAVCARAAALGASYCDVELKFKIEESTKVTAGVIWVDGNIKTRRSVLDGLIAVKTGKVLTEKDLNDTRDSLLRIGVFERVKVRPMHEATVDSVKDVMVEVTERKSYALDLGGGFSTAEGLRGVLAFGDRNFMGTALRLQMQAKLNLFLTPLLLLYDESVRDAVEASYTCKSGLLPCTDPYNIRERMEYALAFGLSYPRIIGLPPGFSAGLDMIALRDYDAAFREEAQRVSLVTNYKAFRPKLFGKPRPVTIQLGSTFERSDLTCNSAIADRPELCSSTPTEVTATARYEGTNFYLGLGPRISWDFRDDPVDPRAGFYTELQAEAAMGIDTGSPNLASIRGRVNAYFPLASRLTFAFAGVFGSIIPLEELRDGVKIPINRLFFAGGRSTVRGYAERSLIPQDAAPDSGNISTGGRSMLALKSELRIDVWGAVALAMFYDIGDLWEGGFAWRTGTRTPVHGGGAGLRVATPIGPLALDLAVPFNKRDGIVNDIQLHFSVGAF